MTQFIITNFFRLYLLTIITKLMKNKRAKVSAEKLKNLYCLVFKMNQMNLKLRDGQTILHLAVNG
jgi:Fem-1 homolog b